MIAKDLRMEFYEQQAKLFKVLMHPTRLAILDILRSGEECVCHMEAVLGLRQAYISQQLMVLRDADLVQDRRDGWNIFYRVVNPQIYEVIDAARAVRGNKEGLSPAEAASLNISSTCTCPKCSVTVTADP
jgi:DNA-binding transcriptional ArsR family regulator